MEVLEGFFSQKLELKGKKLLITAGPTYEKIDPVRFIGNYSSGKMGFALAEVCAQRGADVVLVSGPVSLQTKHQAIRRISVESAEEMYQATVSQFPEMDAAILCAAVADYRPEVRATEKIKRESTGKMTLHLVPNKDIAAALGKMKGERQRLVGFALETHDGLQHALGKLNRKNLDFIVLNSLEDKGAGFQCDTNKVTILDKQGESRTFPLKRKEEVASDIIDKLSTLLK